MLYSSKARSVSVRIGNPSPSFMDACSILFWVSSGSIAKQLMAINNSLMLEKERRKMIADKKKREDGDSDQFNDLINVD